MNKIKTAARVITKGANIINENQKGVDILTKLIYKDIKKHAPAENETVIETVPETPEPVTETNEPVIKNETETVTELVVNETPAVTETVNETPAETKTETVSETTPAPEKKLSIWEQLKKSTQEDKNVNTVKKENAIESLAKGASEGTDYANDEEAKKAGNKVRAAIVVEIADVIFMFVCLLLTWDFSDKNQTKFTLNADRKKAIQNNLFKLYELQNRKSEPKKEIMFLILGSYTPMLLVAVFGLIKRMKEKSESKKAILINPITQTENNVINENEIQLNNERIRNAELQRELENLKKVSTVQNHTNPVQSFGKGEAKRRGVQAGTKRGSYKK